MSEKDRYDLNHNPHLYFKELLGTCTTETAFVFVERIYQSKLSEKVGISTAIDIVLFHELIHICDWELTEYEVERMEKNIFEY